MLPVSPSVLAHRLSPQPTDGLLASPSHIIDVAPTPPTTSSHRFEDAVEELPVDGLGLGIIEQAGVGLGLGLDFVAPEKGRRASEHRRDKGTFRILRRRPDASPLPLSPPASSPSIVFHPIDAILSPSVEPSPTFAASQAFSSSPVVDAPGGFSSTPSGTTTDPSLTLVHSLTVALVALGVGTFAVVLLCTYLYLRRRRAHTSASSDDEEGGKSWWRKWADRDRSAYDDAFEDDEKAARSVTSESIRRRSYEDRMAEGGVGYTLDPSSRGVAYRTSRDRTLTGSAPSLPDIPSVVPLSGSDDSSLYEAWGNLQRSSHRHRSGDDASLETASTTWQTSPESPVKKTPVRSTRKPPPVSTGSSPTGRKRREPSQSTIVSSRLASLRSVAEAFLLSKGSDAPRAVPASTPSSVPMEPKVSEAEEAVRSAEAALADLVASFDKKPSSAVTRSRSDGVQDGQRATAKSGLTNSLTTPAILVTAPVPTAIPVGRTRQHSRAEPVETIRISLPPTDEPSSGETSDECDRSESSHATTLVESFVVPDIPHRPPKSSKRAFVPPPIEVPPPTRRPDSPTDSLLSGVTTTSSSVQLNRTPTTMTFDDAASVTSSIRETRGAKVMMAERRRIDFGPFPTLATLAAGLDGLPMTTTGQMEVHDDDDAREEGVTLSPSDCSIYSQDLGVL